MLPEIKRPDEVSDRQSKILVVPPVDQPVDRGLLRPEKKNPGLINNGSISLPDDSVKALVHQASVTEDAQGVNESQKQNHVENSYSGRNGRY